MKRQKADVVREIATAIGVEVPPMSTGSTEPRAIFDLVDEALGLRLDRRLAKPEIARAIVESSGAVWGADYESRGGTVTFKGLEAVREAVRFFTGK